LFAKLAASEEVDIEANHFVSSTKKYFSRDSSDIAFVAGEQYSHVGQAGLLHSAAQMRRARLTSVLTAN
jgi:hypothetical protein